MIGFYTVAWNKHYFCRKFYSIMKALFTGIILVFCTLVVQAQNVHIPDTNFISYLLSHSGINTNGDNEISATEAATFTGTINVGNSNISDLSGIEAFTSLTVLNCEQNNLTNLDISNNTALLELNCEQNQLTSLNLNNNTGLVELNCGVNQLSLLDVSNNAQLKYLHCHYNQITHLNLNNNPVLFALSCYNNPIVDIDVSNCSILKELYCVKNHLTSLDVSNNPELRTLDCSDNQLTILDVSNNTELIFLNCYKNQLSSLDIGYNTELQNLQCFDNKLISLNVATGHHLGYLSFLWAHDNPDLTCIHVDNVAWSMANWVPPFFKKDATAVWSAGCAPAAPINLNATAGTSSLTATLTWTDHSSDETGFKVERSTDGNIFTEIAIVPENTTSYTDNTVAAQTFYYYRIYGFNATGSSVFSNVATVTTGTTGIHDLNKIGLSIYPNPVAHILNVALKENTQIKILDMTGRTVLSTNINTTGASDYHPIDVSGLVKGIYMIYFSGGGAAKFIKE